VLIGAPRSGGIGDDSHIDTRKLLHQPLRERRAEPRQASPRAAAPEQDVRGVQAPGDLGGRAGDIV
jgi:hypothetical protein